MVVDSDQITKSYAILLGRSISYEVASRDAKVLALREELVACLILTHDIFPVGSRAGDVLVKAAIEHTVESRTGRTDYGDLAGAISARRRTREAIAALISADGAVKATADAASLSMRELAKHELTEAASIDIRWHVER